MPRAMEYFRNQIKLALSNSDDPDQAEIVLSNKGGPKLIDNGFMYTMHKKQTFNIRWRCVLRSSQCRGSLVTSTDFKLPQVRMEHNHGPDFAAARLARTRYMALGKPPVLREENSAVSFETVPVATPLEIKEEPKDNHEEETTVEMVPESNPPSCVDIPPAFTAESSPKQSSRVMQPGSQGTSGGRTIRIATQSLVRQPLRNIAPAPTIQNRQQQQPKTLVLKTIPLKVKQVAPTTIKMAPRQPNIGMPQNILPQHQQPTEVCLRWNSYHSNMQNSFPSLLDTEQFVDVTLACEGRSLKCHKMILSSCSDYLAALLRENPCQHPIILMRDLKFWEVEALVKFMYRGEVNVAHDKLPQLLNAAEALQIKGLAGPSPSFQNSKPPKLVPHSKPLNQTSVPNPQLSAESKEARKRSALSSGSAGNGTGSGGGANSSPKRVHKRQASEPPQPRIFTKIRLQRPVTPTSPNLTVKLEPLDIPLSPTEIFREQNQRDEDISSSASNFDNLVMALHEDEDPGGVDEPCSTDEAEMNFGDSARNDDLNDEQMEFVPTDFLEQEQDIVEEADFSKSSNDEYEDEDDDDDVEPDPDDDYVILDETVKNDRHDRQSTETKKKIMDDRPAEKRPEKSANSDKT